MNAFRLVMLILSYTISAYIMVIVVRIYLSWFTQATGKGLKLQRVLDLITDPWLNLFRGGLRIGVMDFSPVLAIIVLSLLSYVTSTLAGGHTPTVLGVIILFIEAVWRFVRFLAGMLIVLLLVRLITLYAVKGFHPFLDGLDRWLFPRVSRVMGMFTSRTVSYQWALAICAVLLALVTFAANWLVLLLLKYLARL